ncbi:hypothetical protein Poli38472_013627 [Pythium oligandrum]|uniref:Uncharacterized protein n=1 Tax=Pythium oligandrum TaxID=41045 RepID=A0A8K1CD18_PYTOL|nr:hypothetical protein Poli38472_013627 [Pythium oligandrum]|eukprot:TMW61164.1 hypothetical protein Poli38472_013627 [Pythium oligandrum]
MTSSPDGRSSFSTRFFASDGIPEYNALLDQHLGKRREFLLGNRKSLQLLQQTGAIARVETSTENPNQYVVFMHDKREAQRGRRRPRIATTHDAYGVRGQRDGTRNDGDGYRRSGSTPTLPSATRQRDEDEEEEDDDDEEQQRVMSSKANDLRRRAADLKSMGRSVSTTALHDKPTHLDALPRSRKRVESSLASADDLASSPPSTLIEHLRRRRTSQGEGSLLFSSRYDSNRDFPPKKAAATPVKDQRSVVERLMESDATYQLQIRTLRDEMTVLENEKSFFDTQIAKMRKKLRGVNAVKENDAAVAHCSAIMQHRLAKAEEEYMKLVTGQQQVRTEIDTVRRELIAMRKVVKKLESDMHDVAEANAAVEDRIRASKAVRNELAEELIELERRAELEAEEQRLKLPPEENVVVDAETLMSAVVLPPKDVPQPRRRRTTAVLIDGSPLANLRRMLSTDRFMLGPGSDPSMANTKPLLPFRKAFTVIQQTLGLSLGPDSFAEHFEETEVQLLSKHKANVLLQDEVNALEKEFDGLLHEGNMRRATLHGSREASWVQQAELQSRIDAVVARIESYNELRERRNQEHLRLRNIMQHCLETLHAEKLVSRQESLGGPVLLSELTSPAMLEALQKKMTEVAISLKLKHNNQPGSTSAREANERIPRTQRNSSIFGSNKGKNGRRSNFFLKHEADEKIVLGPREPSGSALTAILSRVQPPTAESAQALTEKHGARMKHLHLSLSRVIAPEHNTKPPRKLTLSRSLSIRAGKRSTTLMVGSSSRRLPVGPSPGASPSKSNLPLLSALKRNQSSISEASDGFLQPDDVLARVVDGTDELEE